MKKFITSTLILASSAFVFGSAEDGIIDTDTTWTGSEISITNPLTISSETTFTIGDGVNKSTYNVSGVDAPVANSGKIIVSKNSELYIKSTFNESGLAAISTGKIDVYGTLKLYTLKQSSNLKITDANVYGSLLVEKGTLQLYDKKSSLYLHKNSSIDMIDLYMSSSTVLKLEDNVTFGNQSNAITLMSNQKNMEIDASSTDAKKVELKALNFTLNNTLIIKLSDQLFSVASMNTLKGDMGSSKFILEDFKNDLFKIEDVSNISLTKDGVITFADKGGTLTLSAKDTNGNAIDISAYDGWYFTNDGFLNIAGYPISASVPEPAEWAMILGALALGFAIYRRRK